MNGVVEFVLFAKKSVAEGSFADARWPAHWGRLAVRGNRVCVWAACRIFNYCFYVSTSTEGFISGAAKNYCRNRRIFRPFLNNPLYYKLNLNTECE